jgi:hypothetical protein
LARNIFGVRYSLTPCSKRLNTPRLQSFGSYAIPALTLRELMNEHGLKQTDLLDIFTSPGVVSQVLKGKREISKSQAKKLSEMFRLPIDIFISFEETELKLQ